MVQMLTVGIANPKKLPKAQKNKTQPLYYNFTT